MSESLKSLSSPNFAFFLYFGSSLSSSLAFLAFLYCNISGAVRYIIKKFNVNMGKCILCGNCEYFCPQKAIVLTKEIDIAACDKEELEFNINKLLLSQKESSKTLKRKYNV